MNSRATEAFWDRFYSLPVEAQLRAREAYRLFEQNPQHPSLSFKRIKGTRRAVYSARIDRTHRAVGLLDGDRVVWFWIGAHAEYDSLLRSL